MALHIRAADRDDDRELARIDYESWSPVNSPSALWSRDRPFFGEPTMTRVADVLVAEDGGAIVGYVKLAGHGEPARAGRITGVAVDSAARGRGTGLRLVRAALELASARGYTTVTLQVLGNNVPALRVYWEAGFVEVERAAGRFTINGSPVDDVTLTAQVAAPPANASVP